MEGCGLDRQNLSTKAVLRGREWLPGVRRRPNGYGGHQSDRPRSVSLAIDFLSGLRRYPA